MNRRKFIKRTSLIGTGAAAGVSVASMDKSIAYDLIRGGRSISRTTGIPRLPIPTTCMMCRARCGVIGYLEDNVLLKIEGNPRDQNAQGKICALGIAGIQYTYNPERLLHPMKRTGLRGEGKWQQITWAEALNTIAVRLNELRQQNMTERFVLLNDADSYELLTDRFISAFGKPTVINGDDLYSANQKHAVRSLFGVDELVPDFTYTKYMLNFGSNPFEHHDQFVPFISRLVDGRMNGAKLVTFDPRVNNTSGKSNEWYPIVPGTDMIVALAMANVIVQRGLHDARFISEWCDVPIPELAKFLRQFTPELAQTMSGIKESHIRRIAVEFGTSKPGIAIASGGVSQQKHGVASTQAVLLLNIITGNIENRGGLCLPRNVTLKNIYSSRSATLPPQELFTQINNNVNPVSFLLTHQCNPAFTNPDTMLVAATLKDEMRIPFHVVVDSYFTETALLADLLLPETTYLESWGIHSPPSFSLTPHVVLQQPVIRAKGESRQFHQILLDIVQSLDDKVKMNFVFDKVEKFVKADAENIQGITTMEGGYEFFRETGIWSEQTPPKYYAHQKDGFATSNKKVNISQLITNASQIPLDSPDTIKVKALNEFTLVLYSSAVQADYRSGGLMWLSEIEHENVVWMNRSSASKLEIENEDHVRLSTSTGSISAKVRLTSGIRPDAIAMNQNIGHWAGGRIAMNKRFESENPNTLTIWWNEDSLQPHPLPLIKTDSDPVGKGQVWNQHIVKVEKV